MSSMDQDMFLLKCPTYEDYLNTFITRNDIRFIRNIEHCRTLVELGYRSSSEIYTPAEFEQHKAALKEYLWPRKRSRIIFSEKMTSSDPVLLELASREKLNMQKILSTIIFVKHKLKTGFEISGYIDFEHSLRRSNLKEDGCTDWAGVFAERVNLKAKPHDLSYYDWHKGRVHYNDSENFLVLHNVKYGLMFKHKGDHKIICIDETKELYRKNCYKAMHYSERYGYVMIYDHVIRRKN